MASKNPSRSPGKAKSDALSLLKEDHALVRKMFARFEKLKDEEQKSALIDEACTALTVHATLEEELFYPALRGAIEDEELLDEAQVEHSVAKQLIAQLRGHELEDATRDASFKVLSEYVGHHIEEEEGELFKQVRRSDIDLQSLGEEMTARKQDLEAEMREPAELAAPGRRTRGTRTRARGGRAATTH